MLIAECNRVLGLIIAAACLQVGCRPKVAPPNATAVALSKLLLADTYRRDDAPYSLPYRLHVPRKYDAHQRYPLVLYLHGADGRGEDNLRQLSDDVASLVSERVQSIEPFFVLVPQCAERDEWVNRHDSIPFHNYDQRRVPESSASRMTLDVIRAIQAKYAIDANRLYITGYSMGGSGTWDFVTRHPGVFAGAIPVSGVNDPSRASVLKGTAIWAFHGEKDKVSPATNTLAMVQELRRIGADIRYSEIKGVGHDSNRFAYQDINVLRWLLSQRRR